jgi:large subunit ribosomal protein L23
MNEHNIIKRPIVTEKSQRLRMESNRYTFEVDPRANKSEIKKAIEKIFKVKVESVNTTRLPGKARRFGRFSGAPRSWKKAVAKLKDGQQIELFEGA